LGGQDYFPFGVVERPGSDVLPPEDKGRFAVTKTVSDEYVFRAVPLRNVELTTPYFHSGKVWNLEQAVAIWGRSARQDLTTQETNDIAASCAPLPAGSLASSCRSCLRARPDATSRAAC
jgi:cytochrome c peroxidase